MRGLTSDKQAREEQINKLGMKTNEDAKKCERVILENSRLKNILSAAHMSNVNIQFLNRKKIIPENREELHVVGHFILRFFPISYIVSYFCTSYSMCEVAVVKLKSTCSAQCFTL